MKESGGTRGIDMQRVLGVLCCIFWVIDILMNGLETRRNGGGERHRSDRGVTGLFFECA